MRAFIGTFLSGVSQTAADALAHRLAVQSHGAVRPVPPHSVHITHAFLGEVNEALALALVADLHDLMRPARPIPFRLGRPEILRVKREPRLVLANVVQGAEGIASLARRVGERVRRHRQLADIAPARSPHVTLARFSRGAGR